MRHASPARRADRRRPTARTLDLLRAAAVPLVEGMMLAAGHRVVEVDAGGALRVGDVRPDLVPMLVFVAGQWRWVHDDRVEPLAVPDLGDRGTFMLCLDALAGRAGLDSGAGALWTREGDGWLLRTAAGDARFDVDGADDLEALAAALQATAGRDAAPPRPGHRAG